MDTRVMLMTASLLVALASLGLSAYALYRTTDLQRTALSAAAADRALQRFSRFNEMLFRDPSLHEVFFKTWAEVKRDATQKAFVWFVLNQMEGVYMDFHLGQLRSDSFRCYDTWLRFRMGKGGALRDFLLDKGGERFQYFAEPYQAYLRKVLGVGRGG